ENRLTRPRWREYAPKICPHRLERTARRQLALLGILAPLRTFRHYNPSPLGYAYAEWGTALDSASRKNCPAYRFIPACTESQTRGGKSVGSRASTRLSATSTLWTISSIRSHSSGTPVRSARVLQCRTRI